MKLKRHLGIIMMTAFMLVISMTMITAAADTTKVTFECPPGSVYLLMKMRTIDADSPNPAREDFSVTGAVSCDSFVLYTKPSTDVPRKKYELDCRVIKTGDKTVFDLPNGEYKLCEFFDPTIVTAHQLQTPFRGYEIYINSAAAQPVDIRCHTGAKVEEDTADGFSFRVTDLYDYAPPFSDPSYAYIADGFTKDTSCFVIVQNTNGDSLEGVIVNLELENAQGEMEVVERAVSNSRGRAAFTTDVSKFKGKIVASVTDSADYNTRAEVDLTPFTYKFSSFKSALQRLFNVKKAVEIIKASDGKPIPPTQDTAYIKQLVSEQFSQQTPEELSITLSDAMQDTVLAVKDYFAHAASVAWSVDYFAREEDAILKLGSVDKVPIQVKKIDVAGKELPGAQMELFRQKPALQNGQVVQVEESIAQWTSSETAKAFDVAPGTYRIHEVAAPKGYELAADITFTIDKDGVVQSSTVDSVVTVNGVPTILMEDPKTPPKDPKTDNPPTGDDNNALAFMLLMALSCAGIAVTDKKIKKYNR